MSLICCSGGFHYFPSFSLSRIRRPFASLRNCKKCANGGPGFPKWSQQCLSACVSHISANTLFCIFQYNTTLLLDVMVLDNMDLAFLRKLVVVVCLGPVGRLFAICRIPNSLFGKHVGVQYQIATQAVDLAKQATVPNDIIQSVGQDMTTNQNISDALSAAQSSADGAGVSATSEELISIIEGGNP